jgi:hypothetical protein
VLLIWISFVYSQDISTIEPKVLPYIYLSSEIVTLAPGGMYMGQNGIMTQTGPVTLKKRFYSFDKRLEGKRISYLANNLAQDLKPVPKAYSLINTYKFFRIATPLLMVGGATTLIGGLSYSLSHKTKNLDGTYKSPDFTGAFIGIGILLGSWIPNVISQVILEKAVEKYNSDDRVRKL